MACGSVAEVFLPWWRMNSNTAQALNIKHYITAHMALCEYTDFVSLWCIIVVRNSFTVSGLCLLQGVCDRYFRVWERGKSKGVQITNTQPVGCERQMAEEQERMKPTSYMMVFRFCCPGVCLFFPLSFLCSFRSVRSWNTLQTKCALFHLYFMSDKWNRQ